MKRSITVDLTPKEVADIIKKHLKNEGVCSTESVNFKVGKRYSGNANFFGSYNFIGVKCKGFVE